MTEQAGKEQDSWKIELRDILCRALSNKTSQSDYFRAGVIFNSLAPKTLHKYFPDNDFSIDSITNDSLWYSSPARFNDVFDVDFPVNRKSINESAFEQLCKQAGIKKHDPRWIQARQQIRLQTETFIEEVQNQRLKFGVACFSESDNSLLMWAHYAHNHKGICVEYDMLGMNEQLKFSAMPVLYSDTRPCLEHIDINGTHEETFSFLIDNLMTKSSEWSYEREWRIVRDNASCGAAWDNEKQGALLPVIKPKSIVLGCQASGDFENRVVDCCKERKIDLYKMKKDETEFKLNKEEVLKF